METVRLSSKASMARTERCCGGPSGAGPPSRLASIGPRRRMSIAQQPTTRAAAMVSLLARRAADQPRVDRALTACRPAIDTLRRHDPHVTEEGAMRHLRRPVLAALAIAL